MSGDNLGKIRGEKGTVLIMVTFLSLLLACSAAYLLTRARTEVFRQHFRKYEQQAFQYAISGMNIAIVKVNSAATAENGYIPDPANPNELLNSVLYNADSTIDANAGPGYLIPDPPDIPDEGTYYVTVKRLTYRWYELTSTGTAGDDLVGDIQRTIKYRVKDRSSYSKWSLYCENGVGVVGDTNVWYGDIHTNKWLLLRNRIEGLGAEFYGNVTACSEPVDYVESGGVAEAIFHRTTNWNADRIDLPETTSFAELRSSAQSGSGEWVTLAGPDTEVAEIWVGENGVSVLPLDDFRSLNLVFSKVEDEENEGVYHQKLEIIVSDGNDEFTYTINSLPNDATVHSATGIAGIEGTIYGRVTVANEVGEAFISDDIIYEDDDGNHPYEYDEEKQGDPENFQLNPAYNGSACFALMSKNSIILKNHNGYGRGDPNLVIHGVYAAGIGGEEADGAVRWLDTDEEGYDVVQGDLRLYGSMIADGESNGAGNVAAHFKGWTSGGVTVGGYQTSQFRYDYGLLSSPPPNFIEVYQPIYEGWQLIRGAP